MNDDKKWIEASKAASRAIHGSNGRGMVGHDRRFLQDRVARAILAAAATQPPQDERGQGLSKQQAINAMRGALMDMDVVRCPVTEPSTLMRYFVNRVEAISDYAVQPSIPSALTDDQIRQVRFDWTGDSETKVKFAREILALAASTPAQQAGQIDAVTSNALRADHGLAAGQCVHGVRMSSHCDSCATPPQPVAAEVEDLRKALRDAATSLESINRLAGSGEHMESMLQVRNYAHNRAKVAFAALSDTSSDESGENGNG